VIVAERCTTIELREAVLRRASRHAALLVDAAASDGAQRRPYHPQLGDWDFKLREARSWSGRRAVFLSQCPSFLRRRVRPALIAVDMLVCWYEGDVHGDRVITYDCRGTRVASVTAFARVPRPSTRT